MTTKDDAALERSTMVEALKQELAMARVNSPERVAAIEAEIRATDKPASRSETPVPKTRAR